MREKGAEGKYRERDGMRRKRRTERKATYLTLLQNGMVTNSD